MYCIQFLFLKFLKIPKDEAMGKVNSSSETDKRRRKTIKKCALFELTVKQRAPGMKRKLWNCVNVNLSAPVMNL